MTDEAVVRHRTCRAIVVMEVRAVCRSIKTLFNFEPRASDEELRAASLQFVRKLAGFTAPSRANQQAFDRGVEEVFLASRRLLDGLVTHAPARDRAVYAARARERGQKRRAAGPS